MHRVGVVSSRGVRGNTIISTGVGGKHKTASSMVDIWGRGKMILQRPPGVVEYTPGHPLRVRGSIGKDRVDQADNLDFVEMIIQGMAFPYIDCEE